jgi:hypothetical protein
MFWRKVRQSTYIDAIVIGVHGDRELLYLEAPEGALLGKLWASRKEKESLLVSLWTSRKENGSLLVRRSSCGASGDDDWGLLGSRSRRKSKR